MASIAPRSCTCPFIFDRHSCLPSKQVQSSSQTFTSSHSMTSLFHLASNFFPAIISSVLDTVSNCFILPSLLCPAVIVQTCVPPCSLFLPLSISYFFLAMATAQDEEHFGEFFIEWPIWARLTLASMPSTPLSVLLIVTDSWWCLCTLSTLVRHLLTRPGFRSLYCVLDQARAMAQRQAT